VRYVNSLEGILYTPPHNEGFGFPWWDFQISPRFSVPEKAERAADQLCSWDSNTRRFALQSLGLLGPKAVDHLHAVAKLLDDEEPEV